MKTHFLISESPQKFDQSIQALCGKTLAHPEPVISIEVGQSGLRNFFDPLRDCGKCAEKFFDKPMGEERLYIYGVIEAQEAMHSGDTISEIERIVSEVKPSLL